MLSSAYISNRSGVARIVLKTPVSLILWFINWLTHPFPPNLQHIITSDMSCVTCPFFFFSFALWIVKKILVNMFSWTTGHCVFLTLFIVKLLLSEQRITLISLINTYFLKSLIRLCFRFPYLTFYFKTKTKIYIYNLKLWLMTKILFHNV